MRELFAAALTRPRSERDAYIDAECAADEALGDAVKALVQSHERARSFVEQATVSPQPAPDLLVGATIGPYRLMSRLGAGGMGEVYQARDTRFDRIVAMHGKKA